MQILENLRVPSWVLMGFPLCSGSRVVRSGDSRGWQVSNEKAEGRHSKFNARVYDFVLEDEHRKI